jgi:hypothetical protein
MLAKWGCGGLPGYYEFLKNITSKQQKRRNATLEWYGGPCDPGEINEQQIIAVLNRIAKSGRPSG